MKSLLMSLILTASVIAQATSVDFTKVLATVQGHEHGIVEIALLEDGRLQVLNSKGVVKTTILSKAALNRLSGKIQTLSDVQVQEVNRDKVCKMMIIPTLSDLSIAFFDYEAGEFKRNLNLVLTRKSCALAYEVFPANEHQENSASELRAQLVILALNTLN